jgi:hypothetical protein
MEFLLFGQEFDGHRPAQLRFMRVRIYAVRQEIGGNWGVGRASLCLWLAQHPNFRAVSVEVRKSYEY